MLPDFSPIFREYEELRDQATALFSRVASVHTAEVKCKTGCSDCCHALFDLSLIEAMYINQAFQDIFKHGPERSKIIEKASQTDRTLAKIKREMFKAEKAGESAETIMANIAKVRMPCPLLDDDCKCSLYEKRPITCRLYGIPLEIADKSHVCGISGFNQGKKYPAVKLLKIQAKLEDLSKKIADACESRFDLSEIYVPVSMALLTKYNEKFLGIGKDSGDD